MKHLTETDRKLIIFSLGMRICWIETGTPILRAADAVNQRRPEVVKALTREQRDLVAHLENLRDLIRKWDE